MQTTLTDYYRNTPLGQEADAILRSCVHCGFCTATCPTYQLTGDELDGPRGRIYLIKQILEGQAVGPQTRTHLDRCVSCLSCETTCPSGVAYGRLADIGRQLVEQEAPRNGASRAFRWLLRNVLAYPRRFGPLLRLGQWFRPLIPGPLKIQIPTRQPVGDWPQPRHQRRMLVLDGCVQPGIAPEINAATARVLDRLGISLLRMQESGCCGAISQHLSAAGEAKEFMRRNIDAWWPAIESGAEAIVMTASGCGSLVKEYGYHLREDAGYADRAARVSALARDLSEVLADEDLSTLGVQPPEYPVAAHTPCSLHHAQGNPGAVGTMLESLGFRLAPVRDAHLCCGSAGTYSILQRPMSSKLLANKIAALEAGNPQHIATANIGCLSHLRTGTSTPVSHWIELVDRYCASGA